VISAGSTVLRYARFYGPGTYYETELPPAPRLHIDAVARRTMPFLAGPRGIFTITWPAAGSVDTEIGCFRKREASDAEAQV
jgi:hypothetical protein